MRFRVSEARRVRWTLAAMSLPLAAAMVLGQTAMARGHMVGHAFSTTKVKHFEPFDTAGNIANGYTVMATDSGYCWTTSIASPRADAFRCFIGNQVADPCIRNGAGTQVACPSAGPWRITVINLTTSLPAAQSGKQKRAWLLKVPAWGNCSFVTGATFVIDNKRANFGCQNNVWLFGGAHSHTEPWMIREGKGTHPTLHWVKVKKAWF